MALFGTLKMRVEKHRSEVDIAVSRAGRETGSSADVHSQEVVENRAEADSSHVFPDYSQQIADRTQESRARSPQSPEPINPFCR